MHLFHCALPTYDQPLFSADIRKSTSTEELAFSASAKLYEEGKRAAGDVVTEATQNSPNRPIKMRRLLTKSLVPYTPEEGLALLTNARLTKDACLPTNPEWVTPERSGHLSDLR